MLVAPATGDQVPGPQSVQSDDIVADHVPALQSSHDVDIKVEYVPASHALQLVAPSSFENEPAVQVKQDCVNPTSEDHVPGVQWVQIDDEVAYSTDDHVPA